MDRIVRFLEEVCGVAALAVMFFAIVVQVVFRYLFTPLIWPFELSIFMYICLIYLGAALAMRRDAHVTFDIVFNLLPQPLQRWVSTALRLFGAVALVVMIPPGVNLMRQTHTLKSASLGIPWSFLVLVYLIACLLMAAHLAASALRDARGRS